MLVYSIRLNETELQALKDRAKVENVPPSKLARDVILVYLSNPVPNKKPLAR